MRFRESNIHVILAGLVLSALLIAPARLHARTTRTDKAIPAYNPTNPTQTLGEFLRHSDLQWIEIRSDGFVLVRYLQPNGPPVLAFCKLQDIQKDEVIDNSDPTTPASTPTGAGTSATSVAKPPPPAELTTPGWKTVSFNELPKPAKRLDWLKCDFDPTKEKFLVYIPSTFKPDKPCGIMAWTSSGSGLSVPRQYDALFDEYRLIVIGANDCGNSAQTDRRVGILACAAQKLSKLLPIDPKRCFVSGGSGGGRVSSVACYALPDLWVGAVCMVGVNFHKDCPSLDKPGNVYFGINHQDPTCIPSANISASRQHCKFSIITGPNDSNYGACRSVEKAMKQDGFKVLLIDQPDMGHELCSTENFRKAIEFVLGPPPKD